MANEATTRAQVASTLGLALRAAQARDRADLVTALGSVRTRLAQTDTTIVVAGEYQQGKTALIGALLGIETGEGPAATTVHVTDYVHGTTSDVVDDGGGRLQRREPRALLEQGLRFVDTPGLGATSVVDAAVVEAARADAVVLVTMAGRELTASELWYLSTVRPLVGRLAVVVSGIDIHPRWRTVAARVGEQIAAADLGAEVFCVAAPLRRLALERDDHALGAESGFGPLHEWCLTLVGDGTELRETANLTTLADVLTQLIDGDHTDPPPAPVRPHPGGWQGVLNDRLADLGADVEHQVRSRTRALQRSIEAQIDDSDPAAVWDDLADQLSRALSEAVVETEQLLRQGMVGVGDAVATELGTCSLAQRWTAPTS